MCFRESHSAQQQQVQQVTTVQQQQHSVGVNSGAQSTASSIGHQAQAPSPLAPSPLAQSIVHQPSSVTTHRSLSSTTTVSSVTSISPVVPSSSSTSAPSSASSSLTTTTVNNLTFIEPISSTTSTSSSILASSSVITTAVQDTQDPLLSDILDQVWSMQQEMNIDSATTSQSTITATAHSTTDDLNDSSMILDMLDEVLDPAPPNVSLTSTVNSSPSGPPPSPDINEKLAISAIQRQLMSFENSPSHPHAHPASQSVPHSNIDNRPPMFNQSGPPLQQSPFQSPLCPPPAYQVATTTRNPTQVPHVTSQQQNPQMLVQAQQQPGIIGAGMRRLPGLSQPNGNMSHPTQLIQHRGAHPAQFNVTAVVRPPLQLPRGKGLNEQKKQRPYLVQVEKKLLAQQTQQEYTFSTPQDNSINTDNISDMLNQMPPNVALQMKPRLVNTSDAGQMSPRYPILNVPGVGGVPAQPSPSSVTSTASSSSSLAGVNTGGGGFIRYVICCCFLKPIELSGFLVDICTKSNRGEKESTKLTDAIIIILTTFFKSFRLAVNATNEAIHAK